jgi:hypothetical protein
VRRLLRRRLAGFRRRRRLHRRLRRIPKRFGIELPNDAESRAYRREVEAYWERHLGRRVDASWHLLFAELGGGRDPRYVPSQEWWEDVLPFFNDQPLAATYGDKNLSDVLLQPGRTPVTRVKRMRGRYYGPQDTPVSSDEAARLLTAGSPELVIKPSRTNNGKGVQRFEVDGTKLATKGRAWSLEDLEAKYGADFIAQERIVQHAWMAAVHPASVNTIRVITLRFGGEPFVQGAIARFGRDGRVTDNAGTQGLLVAVDEHGLLDRRATDLAGRVHEKHPDTGHAFTEPFSVPGFAAIRREALRLHGRLFHFDLVSWDFAVAEDGEPIFLEVNFKGMGDAYQFVPRRPFFGDRTTEVLEAIRAGRRRA